MPAAGEQRIIAPLCPAPVDHVRAQSEQRFVCRCARRSDIQQDGAGCTGVILPARKPERAVRHQKERYTAACAAPQRVQQYAAEFRARAEGARERRLEGRRRIRRSQSDHLAPYYACGAQKIQ